MIFSLLSTVFAIFLIVKLFIWLFFLRFQRHKGFVYWIAIQKYLCCLSHLQSIKQQTFLCKIENLKPLIFCKQKQHEFSNALFIIMGKIWLSMAKKHAWQCQTWPSGMRKVTDYLAKGNLLQGKAIRKTLQFVTKNAIKGNELQCLFAWISLQRKLTSWFIKH